jgi:phosphohistidine phosphatase
MTVRTLILLRHAKAADPDAYPTDIERPLSPRGHRDAAAAGAWLREAALISDAVLCSTAVRTRETLQDLGLDEVPVVYEQRVYHGPAPDTLELIQQTDADVATLLVVGHNPTCWHRTRCRTAAWQRRVSRSTPSRRPGAISTPPP